MSNQTRSSIEIRCDDISRSSSNVQRHLTFSSGFTGGSLIHQLELFDGDQLLTSLQSRDWPVLFSLQNLLPNSAYRLHVYSIEPRSDRRSAPLLINARTGRSSHQHLQQQQQQQQPHLQTHQMEQLGQHSQLPNLERILVNTGQKNPQQQFRLDQVSEKVEHESNDAFVPSAAWFGINSRLVLLCLLSSCCLVLLMALFVLILVRIRNKNVLRSLASSNNEQKKGKASKQKSTTPVATNHKNEANRYSSDRKAKKGGEPQLNQKIASANQNMNAKRKLSNATLCNQTYSNSKQALLLVQPNDNEVAAMKFGHSSTGYFTTSGEFYPTPAQLLHLESANETSNTLSLQETKRPILNHRTRFASQNRDSDSLLSLSKTNPDLILASTEGKQTLNSSKRCWINFF